MKTYLDKQGATLLWSRVKEIVNEKASYEIRTTQDWNSDINLKSKKDVLYIYTNYNQDGLFNIKLGDGTSYLIDLPFMTDAITFPQMENHIQNIIIHITQQERERWNNKVSVFIDKLNSQNLVFSQQ